LAYVLNDHDQEGELDGEGLLGVNGAGDVVGAHVGAHDFEHGRLNIGISDTLDVAIAHILVPNLEGLGTKSIG
jgi:hypothetical protein